MVDDIEYDHGSLGSFIHEMVIFSERIEKAIVFQFDPQ